MTNTNKKTEESVSRLSKALHRIRSASKDLWMLLVTAVRGGRTEPLPKHTGVLRRAGIGVVGTLTVMLFLTQLLPNAIWGVGWGLTQTLCQEAEEHAAKVIELKAVENTPPVAAEGEARG